MVILQSSVANKPVEAIRLSFLAARHPKAISGIPVQRIPLRWSDDQSPWCYVVKAATMADNDNDVDDIVVPPPTTNFLATQVWPSARAASYALETYSNSVTKSHLNNMQTICEFGCGPGLPTLTAYTKLGIPKVIATDYDSFALQLVQAAASDQKPSLLSQQLSTQLFDLTLVDATKNPIPKADLYVMSDVFESAHVARGAARHTARILLQTDSNDMHPRPFVWVFAQSDRAQRDVYVKELEQYYLPGTLTDDSDTEENCRQETRSNAINNLQWTALHDGPPALSSSLSMFGGRLWLCDVDETQVPY